MELISSFIRPFELDNPPLMRVGIAAMPAGEHLLLVDMHHIITDGISQSVLIRDFMSLYNGETLPALQLQYKDYAEWQQGMAQKKATEIRKEFWLRQLSPMPAPLELPIDFPRPLLKTYQGNWQGFTLSTAETRKLHSIAETEGATTFMLLLAAYNILLSKLSNQQDVLVGTVLAGRSHADLENIVGMFVNTLPLRNHPKGDMSFREFLSTVRSSTLASLENRDYQYEELIDALQLARDTSRNPLFDVIFSYQNFDRSELAVPGLTLSPYDDNNKVSKFDLALAASGSDEALYFDLEYSTALFKDETIARFIQYFRQILSAIVSDVDQKIDDIEIKMSAGDLEHLSRISKQALPAPKTKQQDIYEAPSNETEERLTAIWSDLLKIDPALISIDSNFFELGGHSLNATRLMLTIKKDFDHDLPLADVFSFPSIKELAAQISLRKDNAITTDESITLLKQGIGTIENIFFVHDGSGDVQGYVELVSELGNYNCWGLRSTTLSSFGPQSLKMQEAAANYIQRIKNIQPAGPYKIAGWSLGGSIGHEIVQQLEAAGETVDA